MTGCLWLFWKELVRFGKVSFQTVLAPIITSLLYLLVFSHVLEGRVDVYAGVSYTAFLVPGHGGPTDVETVRYYTQGYLQYLTAEVQRILEEDGDLADAYDIDQSAYSHLDTFEELAGKNAGRLFQAMEMEYF